MILYSYFRSGAAWRVRIGLHWKGVAFETRTLDLRVGEQASVGWRARNPQGMVPAFELDDGTLLTQSLAILDWLEETVPEPAFLPDEPVRRARIRAVALAIAADTHPIQNLGVLKRIEALAGGGDAGVAAARQWGHDTVARGLAAVEALIAHEPGPFAFGTAPSLADILIVPQLLNAGRFGVDLAPFSRIREVDDACAPLPAFVAARPEVQADYQA